MILILVLVGVLNEKLLVSMFCMVDSIFGWMWLMIIGFYELM